MRKIIATEKIPIKLWLDNIGEGAMDQARNLANLPFAFSHVAIMPDCHEGYGMPIGGVLATRGAIVPNAVLEDALDPRPSGFQCRRRRYLLLWIQNENISANTGNRQ